MQLLLTSDTTSLSYWLNWKFLLCALWVFTSMFVASFIIWKYEYSDHSKADSEGNQQEGTWLWYADEAWKPCLKEIHPICLLIFRIIAFCLLLVAIIVDVSIHGGSLFYYYTQWTFTLVTIYFGFGSLLSFHGCFQHHKTCNVYNVNHMGIDTERGSYVSLTSGEALNGVSVGKNHDQQKENYVSHTALICGHVFEIMFQMSAGAVMLTDIVYWGIIFPFLTIKDYDWNVMTVIAHSLNAVLLLGDTTLNCLRFPWFRISYFILLTAVYVIFEWSVHAFVSIWWPYPFLDLSSPNSPLWYLVVALMHIPCYTLFALIVQIKHYALSRWFPRSYQCLR